MALLYAWLGLASSPADEDDDSTSQPWADLGVTRSSLPPSADGEPRWTYDFSSKRMPGFVPKDLRKTLFQAGRSLRLLREASGGQHPLCASTWALKTGWGWGEDRVLCVSPKQGAEADWKTHPGSEDAHKKGEQGYCAVATQRDR